MTTTTNGVEAPATRPMNYTAGTGESAGVTPELRSLLSAYSDALDQINKGRLFTGVSFDSGWVPRKLRTFPALRYFVSALLVRYLYRSADALKAGVMKCAVRGTSDENTDDLDMLENFERSLPPRLRLTLILPVIPLAVLAFSYLLTLLLHAGYRNLFGDLATAAITVNRAAVVTAFANAHRLAALQYPLEAYYFAGAALIVIWSAILAILPLLPAFYLVRRKLKEMSEVEASGYDAVQALPVYATELDLLVRLLLIPAVALVAIAAAIQAARQRSESELAINVSVAIAVIASALMILAGIELASRYRERHDKGPGCRSVATRVSFATVATLSACLFFALPAWEWQHNNEFTTWKREVAPTTPHPAKPGDNDDGARGWLTDQVSFLITDIQPNAQCHESPRAPIENQQYLRFNIEMWSDVDQFANQFAPYALTLPHWSVRDSHGNLTGSLYLHAQCSPGTDGISKPISPGTHTFSSVVVSAPKDAACLQLDVPNYRGKWGWKIPPMSGDCKPN
ncbi:hypothetical protein [Mycobacterium paraterrae]|uniref:Uncharacterized protein n=1 Tax=Mycobacterium paraterrae TaxID=577492 RepID=A0ABY3VTB9_9MYCO|nr:hypothetical protein [Mycobacterium paraterrae]UMB70774.1 hypothetical protein MKK62_05600 [Mycobacterium paraterrae]